MADVREDAPMPDAPVPESGGSPKRDADSRGDRDPASPGSPAEGGETTRRTARVHKPAQRYILEAQGQAAPREIELRMGEGTRLRDIPAFEKNFKKLDVGSEVTKRLHKAMYGADGAQGRRKVFIGKWCGCSEKEAEGVVQRLVTAKMVTTLKEVAKVLCLHTGGAKDEIADRIGEFLQNPSDGAMNQKSLGRAVKVRKSISKKKARDPNKPKKPSSSYFLFMAEKRAAAKENDPDATLDMSVLAEEWKATSDEQKKPYEKQAKKLKEAHDEEMEEYRKNNPRRGKRSKKGKKGKERDPNKPKKPMSGYFLYLQDRRAGVKEENPTAGLTETAKIVAAEWRDLDEEKKKPYQKKAKKLKEAYDEEMEDYKKKNPTKKKRASTKGKKGKSTKKSITKEKKKKDAGGKKKKKVSSSSSDGSSSSGSDSSSDSDSSSSSGSDSSSD